MSKVRYYFALVAAAIVFIALNVIFFCVGGLDFLFWLESILFAYMAAAFVAELIFWDCIPMRVYKFLLAISIVPISFAYSLVESGSALGFILGMAIFSPCLGALAAVFTSATLLFMILSSIMFIFHIFTLRADLY
jgi:hypothetical protein